LQAELISRSTSNCCRARRRHCSRSCRFGAARIDRVWPDATPVAYVIIVGVAVALTGLSLLGTTRRTIRGPAVAALC
jgi:hypothetical protein